VHKFLQIAHTLAMLKTAEKEDKWRRREYDRPDTRWYVSACLKSVSINGSNHQPFVYCCILKYFCTNRAGKLIVSHPLTLLPLSIMCTHILYQNAGCHFTAQQMSVAALKHLLTLCNK